MTLPLNIKKDATGLGNELAKRHEPIPSYRLYTARTNRSTIFPSSLSRRGLFAKKCWICKPWSARYHSRNRQGPTFLANLPELRQPLQGHCRHLRPLDGKRTHNFRQSPPQNHSRLWRISGRALPDALPSIRIPLRCHGFEQEPGKSRMDIKNGER